MMIRIFSIILLLQSWLPIQVAAAQISCQENDHPDCADNNPFNGYWWNRGWVPFYPSIESWFLPAPVWAEGGAVFYEPGPMVATAKLRGFDLSGYKGGVALMSPADIGQTVWLKPADRPWEGPYLVVDSASRGDIFPIIKYRKEIVEVDWHTAIDWGMVHAGGKVIHWRLDNVQVSKIPPDQLQGCPVDYPSWWLDRAQPSGEQHLVRTPVYRFPRTWNLSGQWVEFASPRISDLRAEQISFRKYLNCQLDNIPLP
jgi:hypothetical protein